MALKKYEWNGSTWQFEDGEAPKGAVEVKASKPAKKAAAAPKEKAGAAPKNKAGASESDK